MAAMEIRSIESSEVTEIYISATPDSGMDAQTQAGLLFSDVRRAMLERNACLLQERVFGTAEGLRVARKVRAEVYGGIDDGAEPSYLVGGTGTMPVAGVHVHAVVSKNKPEVIRAHDKGCGRVLRTSGRTYLTLSGISGDAHAQRSDQARSMMERTEAILRQFGADYLSVPRTWMWLGDILAWYDEFNRVRNEFFRQRGLIGEGTRQSMPASTGIGLYPLGGGHCAMDLAAVLEPRNTTRYLQAVGRQQCALEYGSAFSRASMATTPAAETTFVSGTASIDAAGVTTNVADPRGQVNTTVENVRAVLADVGAGDSDVVQAVAYCKTAQVEAVFNEIRKNIPWPFVTVICDICRPDLLFEIEATAVRD